MRTLRLLAMALMGAALVAGLLQLQKNPEMLMPPETASAKPESTTAAVAGTTESPKSPAASAGAPDFGRLYRESTDYLALADQLRPLATRGDAAAQYWLSRVFNYCDQEFGRAFGFGGEGSYLTPEEVLQRWPGDDRFEGLDALRLIHRRCETLVKDGYLQFNDYDQLLHSASKAGYPRAQVNVALFRVGRGANGTAEAINLTRQALRSDDPEVVMAAARVALSINTPDYDLEPDQIPTANARASLALYGWQAAACLRGADCGPETGWVRRWCRRDKACQPFETGMDLLRRAEPERFDVIMMRAREINDLIDAGRWDEIELR